MEHSPVSPGSPTPTLSAEQRASILYPEDAAPEETLEETTAETPSPNDNAIGGEVSLPESYDLKVEGDYAIDPVLLKEATPVFRDLGVTNDQVNKLTPLATKLLDRLQDAQIEEYDALKASWARDVMNDPSIGGHNWAETSRLMNVALEAGGAGEGSAFRKLMDESGIGNHPEMVRLLRRIGYQLAKAGKGSDPQRDRLKALYPKD